MVMKKMVTEKTWKEFRDAGLLLLVNQFLHIFGWAIVVEVDNKKPDAEPLRVYIARVKFRGFNEKATEDAYIKISKYMADNCDELLTEVSD